MHTNPDVDWFFTNAGQWQQEYNLLRRIVLTCDLTESLKWGCPCYTYGKANVVLIHGFKNYCALLFMKGALLTDAKQILVQQTENVQAARQIRFTGLAQIKTMQADLPAYINEAVALEKAGVKVALKSTTDFVVAAEFQAALDDMQELKTAFESLTPGRQRAYLLYFSSPKQTKTREARIEKYVDKILQGKGLDD